MRIKKAIAGFTAAAAALAGGVALAAPAQAKSNSSEAPSVYDIARDASKGKWAFDRNGDDFDILLAAVRVTGLKGALDNPKADLTVFAPTDAVFKQTFGGRSEVGTLIRALKAVNYDLNTLRTVLLYHVTGLNTDGEKGLSFAEVAAALEGGDVTVPMLAGGNTIVKGDLTINGTSSGPSGIVATDIGLGEASNGVIHVIGDSVLLP
ncbi:MAG: fasciclin domain-containing protein [Jiangellales bacterium]